MCETLKYLLSPTPAKLGHTASHFPLASHIDTQYPSILFTCNLYTHIIVTTHIDHPFLYIQCMPACASAMSEPCYLDISKPLNQTLTQNRTHPVLFPYDSEHELKSDI